MLRIAFVVFSSMALLFQCSSPGTLGASASADLECSEHDVMWALDNLIDSSEFTIPIKDSSAVNWWSEGGFDFLNYRCVKIKRRYYMISLNSDDLSETSISIRSLYDPRKKSWKFAKEFNSADEYNAGKAMKLLIYNLPSCE